MSAVPVGIDVNQFNWAVFEYFPAPGALFFAPGWLVTKVSVFAAADTPASVRFFNTTGNSLGAMNLINIAPGGCYVCDPGGAYRREIEVQGAGSQVVIEFWFQARAGSQTPIPTPDVTVLP